VATIQLAKESRESIALAIPEKMLLGINPEEQVFGHSIKKVG